MKDPEPTVLTHEITAVSQGRVIDLTRERESLPVWLRLPPTSFSPILGSRNQTFTVQDTRRLVAK
jgi:hypothetical protein